MKKKELCEQAGISLATIRKLSNGDNVTMEVIEKICRSLDCSVGFETDFIF
jgi:DNA-binding Xre family transcriptional regulator